MNTKLKIGDKFYMGRKSMEVVSTTTFSGVLHYGFIWIEDSGEHKCGWMPVSLVEEFTGYETCEKVSSDSRRAAQSVVQLG